MTSEEREKAGGPAFPVFGYEAGMTMRDYFAGQALVGLLAFNPGDEGGVSQMTDRAAARDAYAMADAMLVERTVNRDEKGGKAGD